MSVVTRNLRQTITYWAFNGVDNSGDPSFATPTTITGRWEDRALEVISSSGERVVSRSVVYLAQDVNLGDYMFLGTDTTASPVGVIGAFPVRDFRKIPNIRGTIFERRAILTA